MSEAWKGIAVHAIAGAERMLRGGSPRDAAQLREIRNFLVLQCESPLGSVVHSTPLYQALKRAIPGAEITVAASKMAASVLGNHPAVDRCVVVSNPADNLVQAIRDVRDLLASMPAGPRCILTTVGNTRPRISLIAIAAGKGIRAGYTLYPELYDLPLSFVPERGQIEANLDIVRALGHEAGFLEPRIYFTAEDAEYASGLLGGAQTSASSARIAFVTCNSGGQRNQWSSDRFREVAADLSRSRSAVPVFLGTAADRGEVKLLRQSLPNRGICAAGKTTIPQLAALLAQCDLVITLDTGTFHVARAVQLPGVVIAPAWQSPLEWLPVNHPSYRVLRGPSIAAAPADYWIAEVSAVEAIDAAHELLRAFPPSESARRLRVKSACVGASRVASRL